MAVILALIFLGLQVGLSVPFGSIDIFFEQALRRPSPQLSRNLIVIGIVNIIAAGGAIAFGLFLNRMPLRRAIPSPRVNVGSVFAVVLVSFGGGVVLSELDNLIRWVLPPPRVFQEIFSEMLFHGGGLPSQIFLLMVVAPVTEEVMFRGIVLRGLLSRHRPWIAVVLSAALFGAVHMNPWQFVPATFLGIAFGWFYLRTGSVPLTMIGHACFNGLALLAARSAVDIPGLNADMGGSVHFQPWWADLTGAGLLVTGILLFAATTKAYSCQPPEAPPVIPFEAGEGNTAVEAPPRIETK
jgi:membrane protease YdiL (CAAX protease family)